MNLNRRVILWTRSHELVRKRTHLEKREPQEISARSGRKRGKSDRTYWLLPSCVSWCAGWKLCRAREIRVFVQLNSCSASQQPIKKQKYQYWWRDSRTVLFSASLVAVVYVNGMRRSLSCFGDSNVLFALCETETEGKRCSWRWDSEWRRGDFQIILIKT